MSEGNDGGQKCRVDVVRSEPGGIAKVTRGVLADGQCLCTVRTGPQADNGSAENIVREVLESRSCDGAPPAGQTADGASAGGSGGSGGSGGAGGAGGGGSGGVIGGVVGAVAVGGLAAGLGGKSKG